jgi:multisubunit Na+/H+ antiporter MnhG subunit
VSVHQWVLVALVGSALLLTLVCAVGVLAMQGPMQKLHYLAPPATLSAFAIAAAAFYDGKGLQPGGKALVVAIVLTLMNAVVTHATARAAWVRVLGRFSSDPADADLFARKAIEPGEDPWEDAP